MQEEGDAAAVASNHESPARSVELVGEVDVAFFAS